MSQEDILNLLDKNRKKKFNSNQIAKLLNQSKNSINVNLKKIRVWKMAEFDTVDSVGVIPYYIYWRE